MRYSQRVRDNWIRYSKLRETSESSEACDLETTWNLRSTYKHTLVDVHTEANVLIYAHISVRQRWNVEAPRMSVVASYVRRASNIHSAGSTKWSLGFKHVEYSRPSIYRSFRQVFCTRSGFTRIRTEHYGRVDRPIPAEWLLSNSYL